MFTNYALVIDYMLISYELTNNHIVMRDVLHINQILIKYTELIITWYLEIDQIWFS